MMKQGTDDRQQNQRDCQWIDKHQDWNRKLDDIGQADIGEDRWQDTCQSDKEPVALLGKQSSKGFRKSRDQTNGSF